jgi:hypothetical protein
MCAEAGMEPSSSIYSGLPNSEKNADGLRDSETDGRGVDGVNQDGAGIDSLELLPKSGCCLINLLPIGWSDGGGIWRGGSAWRHAKN